MPVPDQAQQPRIVIGGFGAAGAATALALVAEGVSPADIAIVDANPQAGAPPKGPDARILALNAGSCRFLEAIGVWERLAGAHWPMRAMALSDSALNEEIRPRLLDIDAPAEEGAPLAHMVPLGLLNAALCAACREAGIVVLPARITAFHAGPDHIAIDMGEAGVKAALLIGADGANSPIRRMAGIVDHGWAYGQTAIVATIRHTLPHHGEAVQHFLPSGPFALLPLDENRSSIVWSEQSSIADRILKEEPQTQLREIAHRAAGWRGEITAVEAISAHPLRLMLARRFVGERLALVADAAHVVHPLAGQGLNLGFEDAALLAEKVADRLRLGLDPGAPDLLESYQAARRPAAVAMAFATDGINRLFSNDSGPLRVLRDFGMGIVDRLPGAKRHLVGAAAGQGRAAPRLFRG